jgi:hypothetical protein
VVKETEAIGTFITILIILISTGIDHDKFSLDSRNLYSISCTASVLITNCKIGLF